MAHEIGSSENPIIISDNQDSDSDTTYISTPQFLRALGQDSFQNVPNNFRLDETAPIITSDCSTECQCLGSTQPLENRAQVHSEGHLFDNRQSQLLSHEDFSCLSLFKQQQYFNEISEALHHWQIFGNSCPRIDNFILSRYDNDNRLTATEQETAALLQENSERKWAFTYVPSTHSAPVREVLRTRESVRWLDDSLLWSAVYSYFELNSAQVSSPCNNYDIDGLMRQHGLFYHISSPLFLYRTSLLIEDLKDITTDRYKCCWDTTIRHLELNSTQVLGQNI